MGWAKGLAKNNNSAIITDIFSAQSAICREMVLTELGGLLCFLELCNQNLNSVFWMFCFVTWVKEQIIVPKVIKLTFPRWLC